MGTEELVGDAEEQITQILSQLEKDSGFIVDGIEVQTLDVGTDDSTKYVKLVRIVTRPSSGVAWDTASKEELVKPLEPVVNYDEVSDSTDIMLKIKT